MGRARPLGESHAAPRPGPRSRSPDLARVRQGAARPGRGTPVRSRHPRVRRHAGARTGGHAVAAGCSRHGQHQPHHDGQGRHRPGRTRPRRARPQPRRSSGLPAEPHPRWRQGGSELAKARRGARGVHRQPVHRERARRAPRPTPPSSRGGAVAAHPRAAAQQHRLPDHAAALPDASRLLARPSSRWASSRATPACSRRSRRPDPSPRPTSRARSASAGPASYR